MKTFTFVLSLITQDNDYQIEQAAAAEEAARRLGVQVRTLFADSDAIQQSQQLLKIIQSNSDSLPDGILIESAGGTVLSGMCFYQSYAREIAQAKGWKLLATNSAKLVNILGGYGYVPMLASMEACVEAAEKGRLA